MTPVYETTSAASSRCSPDGYYPRTDTTKQGKGAAGKPGGLAHPTAKRFRSTGRICGSCKGDRACAVARKPLAIVTHAIDVDAAIAAAKAAEADVSTRSGGTVRIDDLRTDTVLNDRDDPSSTLHHRVTITAVLEHDLADDDVFARSAVVAHLVESLRPLLPPPQHNLQQTDTPAPKGPPALTYAVGRVEPGIKDIEQYRQRLLDGWAARVLAMSKSVGGDEVDLQSCQAPLAVQVRGGTFEKFGVSLPISCSMTIKARS